MMQKHFVTITVILVAFFLTNLAAAAPTWVTNLPLNQWYQIPNTALSSVAPSPTPMGNTGPSAKIDAWNGATLKRSGSVYMLGAAGGHADYAGNEVDALTLNTESPAWVQLRAPSANTAVINSPASFYLDLRPAATHTYYATHFIDALNRMFVVASPGLNGPFPAAPVAWAYTGSQRTFSYNMTTGDWDPPDYVAPYTGGGDFTAAVTVKHQITGDIYMSRVFGGPWWKWTQTANSWSSISNGNGEQNYAGSAMDPTRNRFLVVGSYGGSSDPRVYNTTGQPVSVSFGGLGASALRLSGYPGVVYDEVNDKFWVAYNDSGSGTIKLFRIDASTWYVDQPTMTGTAPAVRPNGIHNSLQYVPELGGIAIANSYTGNVYFMRLSTTGVPIDPQVADTTAPSVPTGVSATPVSSSQINLSWSSSTDNVGVAGYNVYRNNIQVASAATNSYSDTALSPSTTYQYKIAAYDVAGNNSAQTADLSAATLASTIPPPPSTGTLPSLVLTSPATQGSAPFTIGHAFKQGDVPSGSTIVADIANFQATIKNTWPDGSARFAILAGRADLTANTPRSILLAAGANPGGTALTETDLSNTGITASIQVGATCTVDLRSLIGVASSFSSGRWTAGRVRTWISGPQMSSWIYYSRCGSDPHLTTWFEIRLYAGGAVEVLPWVENSTLAIASPATKSAQTVTFKLGGTQRYSGSLAIPHHARIPLASGSTFSHWLGSDPAVTPKHDVAYLQATKMVPTYRAVTASNSTLWSRVVQTYTPLIAANIPYSGMGGAGYGTWIGPLPEHDVAYLTSSGDPRALAAIQVNAYAAGAFDIHFRDETTNQPPKFSSYPTKVIGGGENIGNTGSSTIGDYTPTATGAGSANWDLPHHPSLGYMAYLLLGRFYFLEESQFVATVNYLINSDSAAARNFSNGLFKPQVGANTNRGAAWATRTLVQAAVITPDGETLQTEFLNSWVANINYFHATYVAQSNNPQGIVAQYTNYSGAGISPFVIAPWQEDFFTFAWGYGMDLNLNISGTASSNLSAFFNWKANSIVGRLGGTGSTEWYFADAANYNMPVSPSGTANWDTGAGPWYASFGAMYNVLYSVANPRSPVDGNLRGGNFPEATSYWGNLQPAIAYAVTGGVLGAQAAYNRMIGAGNWGTLAAGFNDNPVWSIVPATASVVSSTVPNAPTNLSLQ